jgi:hypothetical protein
VFPKIEPFESGMLEVADSQRIYWECCGNPDGQPVVYLHALLGASWGTTLCCDCSLRESLGTTGDTRHS